MTFWAQLTAGCSDCASAHFEVCNGMRGPNRFKEQPRAKDKHLMPTFPTREEKKLTRAHVHTSPDPRVVESRRSALGKSMDQGGGLFVPNVK